MRRVAGAALISIVVGGVSLTTVRAQSELPACPNSADAVQTFPPDYVRVGESLAFRIERSFARRVASVRVRYPTRDGVRKETFYFGDRYTMRVIRPAPGKPRRFDMAFRWVQNVGRDNACRGADIYEGIPIVERDARVGDPTVWRFAGRYRARYSDGRRRRWKLRPRCDYFGCRARMQSSSGLRGKFLPSHPEDYWVYKTQRVGYCEVTFITGAKRRYPIYRDTEIKLDVRRGRDRTGLATRLAGEFVEKEYAGGNGYDICGRPRDHGRIKVNRRG